MASLLLQLLPLALGVMASPLPVIAVILVMLTPRARANGLAFALGWVVGLLVVGTIGVLVVDQTSDYGSEGANPVARWAKGILGLLLILLAARQWMRRPTDGEPAQSPKWMGALAAFTPVRCLGLGVSLAAVKPKNLILTLAAAAVISEAGLARGPELAALAVFVVVASVGVVTPVATRLALGDRAAAILEGWSSWLGRHNDVVVATVMLAIGVILLAMGITG